MKESILAQKLTQEFVSRFPMMAHQFNLDLFVLGVLTFLEKGSDDDDRAESLRLSFAQANRRSTIESVLENAQRILNWPPKPKPIVVSSPKRRAPSRKRK